MVMPPAEIVLLPGNMCDSTLWDGVRGDLKANEWRVSDADLTRDVSIEAMAQRTLASCEGSVVPIGFSMGGIVALEMARIAADRIAGLVLLDTNPGADLPERADQRPVQQERVRRGELEAIVRSELKPNYLAVCNRADRSLQDHLLAMAMRVGEQAFIRQSEALRTRKDNWAVLDTFERPFLIACGAEDTLCPPEWHQRMAERARRAELHIVSDAGHMLPIEQPGRLRRHLSNFLSALKGASD